MENNNERVIRAATRRKTLAELYNIGRKIITKRLRALGITHSKTLQPKEILLFVRTHGLPENCEMRIPMDHPLNQ